MRALACEHRVIGRPLRGAVETNPASEPGPDLEYPRGRAPAFSASRIGDEDARRLVATLLADGSPNALTAAEQLEKGVERDLTPSV